MYFIGFTFSSSCCTGEQIIFTKRQLVQLTCAIVVALMLTSLIILVIVGLFLKFGPEIYALGNMTGVTVVDAGGFVGEIEVPVNLMLKMFVRAGNSNPMMEDTSGEEVAD